MEILKEVELGGLHNTNETALIVGVLFHPLHYYSCPEDSYLPT